MGFVPRKRGELALRLLRCRRANIMHEMYFLMFQAIMVMLVVLALLQYTNNVATDIGFEKRFTSMDIGLLTTAIYYAPGTLFHSYWPVDFPVPMDFVFADSAVDIMERGQELHVFYWFLSDMNLDILDEIVKLNAHRSARELRPGERPAADEFVLESWFNEGGMAFHRAQNITYYKTGRQVVFDKAKANPLQQVCPVVNTSDNIWESFRFFVAKVLPEPSDYNNQELHVNRIAQVLSVKYPQFQLGQPTASVGLGSAVGAIPADASIVIVFGDSGEAREAGGLVVYVPIDENVLKNRKLACLLVNDLLTPKTEVFYSQVMPVSVDSLKDDSPLRVFKERSNPDQLMVFIDLSTFGNDQVDIENTADAIYRAVGRFYGVYDLPGVEGPTLVFTVGGTPERGVGAARPAVEAGAVSGTPARDLTGTGSSPPERMRSVCTESDFGVVEGLENLKSIVKYWVKESLDDGAVYVRGGFTHGGFSCTNNAQSYFAIHVLKMFFPSDPLPSICNPEEQATQTQACIAALRQDYQSKIVDKFKGKYLCGDCGTYQIQMFRCAFGKLSHFKTFPTDMPVIAGTPGSIKSYSGNGEIKFNDAVWGKPGESCWDSVVVPQLGGKLQFGDIIQLIPNHYVLYTGGAGLDYELVEMGAFGVFSSTEGLKKARISFEINGQKPNGVRAVKSAEDGLKRITKGCLIRRASDTPSQKIV